MDLEIKENQKVPKEKVTWQVVEKKNEKEPKLTIKLPYPNRNQKKDHHEKIFENFLEMFKKL